MVGAVGKIEDLKRRLEAAVAAQRAASTPFDLERVHAAAEERLHAERALAHAEGRQVADACSWEAPWEVGAPCPFVFAGDVGDVRVAYYTPDSWRPPEPPDGDGEVVAVVSFHRCLAHSFGPPNDEALSGHPLYGSGLRPYGAHVVARSSWIAELERRNRVHSAHKAEHFQKYRHYILCFHDSTFECVAEGHRTQLLRGTPSQAVVTRVA